MTDQQAPYTRYETGRARALPDPFREPVAILDQRLARPPGYAHDPVLHLGLEEPRPFAADLGEDTLGVVVARTEWADIA